MHRPGARAARAVGVTRLGRFLLRWLLRRHALDRFFEVVTHRALDGPSPATIAHRLAVHLERFPTSVALGLAFDLPRHDRPDRRIDEPMLARFIRWAQEMPPRQRALQCRLAALDILKAQERRSARLRLPAQERWRAQLATVLLSGFDACNLACRGCASARQRDDRLPSLERLDDLVQQLKRMNVPLVHIVGRGEPFLHAGYRDVLFELARRHDDFRFRVLTNGTRLTADVVRQIAELGNIVPFVSIDGLGGVNDARRGAGTFATLLGAFDRLRRQHVLFCASVTVHRNNWRHVTSMPFVDALASLGARTAIFCRYQRVGTVIDAELTLRPDDIAGYEARLTEACDRSEIPLRDQTLLERGRGCQARQGRVIFIDGLSGAVTPCVNAPFAPPKCNLFANGHRNRLLEILGHPYFRRYRADYRAGRDCHADGRLERAWLMRAPELPPEVRRHIDELSPHLSSQSSTRPSIASTTSMVPTASCTRSPSTIP